MFRISKAGIRAVLVVVPGLILVCGIINVWMGVVLHHSADSKGIIRQQQQQQQKRQQIVVRGNRVHPGRPSLDSIVQGWNITGDSSWLLDFAIVGFPKCGTSSLMFHLQNHEQVQIFTDERCDLSFNQQAKLIKDIYNDFPADNGDVFYRRGIKCPLDLENPKLAMLNYNRYFPKTNFIVGIRHPILWFESFYNFRIHNMFDMPHPLQLIGRCKKHNYNLCTFRSNFHVFLATLNRTNMTTDRNERQLVALQHRRSITPTNVSGKVFLYEVSQLSSTGDNTDRQKEFLRTLQNFLNLTVELDPMMWFKPGVKHNDSDLEAKLNAKKIDICRDDTLQPLRNVLMEQAVNVSRWIRRYFIHGRDVVVASPDHFVQILEGWERDPCLDRV